MAQTDYEAAVESCTIDGIRAGLAESPLCDADEYIETLTVLRAGGLEAI